MNRNRICALLIVTLPVLLTGVGAIERCSARQTGIASAFMLGGFHSGLDNRSILSDKQVAWIISTSRNSSNKRDYRTESVLPTSTFQALLDKIQGSISDLEGGKSVKCFAELKSISSDKMVDRTNLHVLIAFDKRPEGGILNVTVDMRPSFSGIGALNRPYATQTITQCIETPTPELIKSKVAELIAKLGLQEVEDNQVADLSKQ